MKAGKIFAKLSTAVCYLLAISTLAMLLGIGWQPNVRASASGLLVFLIISVLFAYIGSRLTYRFLDQRLAGKLLRGTFWFAFGLYALLLLILTELGGGYRHYSALAVSMSYGEYIRHDLNLIPFRTISEYISDLYTHDVPARTALVNLLGNLVAFMPFALFLPILFKHMNHWKPFVTCMVLIVTSIELLQLILMVGSCDIDDLILNVGGSCILFAILKNRFGQKFIHFLTKQKVEAVPISKN